MMSARSSGFLRPANAILVPGAQLLRVGEEGVEVLVVPGALLPGQRARVAKPSTEAMSRPTTPHSVRADLGGAALLEAVAGGALRAPPSRPRRRRPRRAAGESRAARGGGCAGLGLRASPAAACSAAGAPARPAAAPSARPAAAAAAPPVRRASAAGASGSGSGLVGERAQIEDHVGPIFRLLEAGEGHLGAGRPALRVGQEIVQALVGPRHLPSRAARRVARSPRPRRCRGRARPTAAGRSCWRRPARSCGRPRTSWRPPAPSLGAAGGQQRGAGSPRPRRRPRPLAASASRHLDRVGVLLGHVRAGR